MHTSQKGNLLTGSSNVEHETNKPKVFGSSDYDMWARNTKPPLVEREEEPCETSIANTHSSKTSSKIVDIHSTSDEHRTRLPPLLTTNTSCFPVETKSLSRNPQFSHPAKRTSTERRRIRLCTKSESMKIPAKVDLSENELNPDSRRVVKAQLLNANFDNETEENFFNEASTVRRLKSIPAGRGMSPMTSIPAARHTRFPALSGSVRRLPAPIQLQQIRAASEPLRHMSLPSSIYNAADLSLPVPFIESTNLQTKYPLAQTKLISSKKKRNDKLNNSLQFFQLVKEKSGRSNVETFNDCVLTDKNAFKNMPNNNESSEQPQGHDEVLLVASDSTITTFQTESHGTAQTGSEENPVHAYMTSNTGKSVRYKVAAPMLSRSHIISVLDDLDAIPV